jgi:hypothetical protein
MRVNARKGSFSMNAVQDVLSDLVLLKGYQSKISRTRGRLTAIGLLIRARAKKPRAER